MDTFKIVQTKEVEQREALKQMQQFLKREEQNQMKDAAAAEPESNRVDDNVITQIKTVKDALVAAQSR